MKRVQKDPDILEEYDFSKGIRGKYAKRYAEGTNARTSGTSYYAKLLTGKKEFWSQNSIINRANP